MDRRDLIAERRRTLEHLSLAAGSRVHVVEIFSMSDARPGGVRNVRVELEALPNTYRSGHIAVFCTHQAIKDADLSQFSDWHLVIDEAPSLWDRGNLNTSVSRSLVADLFEIDRGEVANRILPRTKMTTRALEEDSLAGVLASIQSRVRNTNVKVLTFVNDWNELARNPCWTWYSLWSVRALVAFDSVTVLAADFEQSFAIALCRSTAPEITWVPLAIGSSATAAAVRSVTIRYFSEEHHASRYRFNSDAGKAALAKVATYLDRQGRAMIWTCNSDERAIFAPQLKGTYLSPRQAGTNAWAHIDAAAIIFTSKPDADERTLLKSMAIDPQIVVESREHDTIYQFCARTSLRDASSNRPVTLYVYDRVQAQVLQRALSRQAEFNVSAELIDLGFAHDTKRKSLEHLTAEQRLERKRELARLRKAAQRERDRQKPL